jgi:hypothetical protein
MRITVLLSTFEILETEILQFKQKGAVMIMGDLKLQNKFTEGLHSK